MKPMVLLFWLLPVVGNVYVLWHIWRLLPAMPWVKTLVVVLMVCAFLLLFAGVMGIRMGLSMPLQTVVYEIGTSWLVILLYLFMAFLLLDVGRWLRWVPASLLKDSVAGSLGILGLMLVLFCYGNMRYHHKQRQPLELKTEKKMARSQKMVMMSDLHLGFHNRRAAFARWVDLVNAEHPDLILIAGDIIDVSTAPLEEEGVAEEFRRLNAPVIACWGNHEHYAGASRSSDFYRDAGIILLRDSVMEWGDICIVGREDRSKQRRKPLADLMKGIDRSKYVILLDHQPYHLEEAEKNGVDFQLSGHTHHGQIWPISWITDALYECASGEWQRGKTRYYVSSGMGIWGGKFRIGTRSEYVVATLEQKSSND
ncbi:MAG: metallophosphoesterase [Prevotellaceae bacterium]|nr:metallophosphoesterase [Prevotellaceae bacterium]